MYLNIDGFEDDGSIVTHTLGIEPSELRLKGSLSPRGTPRTGGSWYLYSDINSVDVVDHIERLMDRAKNLSTLKKRIPAIDALIQVVVNKGSEESMPILTFNIELMQKLVKNGFGIDIDIV